MKPKGSTMLKVTGILYIIGAACALLLGLLVILGGIVFGSVPEIQEMLEGEMAGLGWSMMDITADLIGVVLSVLGMVVLLSGGFTLIVGILGVKNCTRPEKANVCFVLGIILCVLQGMSLVTSIVGGDIAYASIGGIALAVLYTFGAYQVKNSPTVEWAPAMQQPAWNPATQQPVQPAQGSVHPTEEPAQPTEEPAQPTEEPSAEQ